MTLSRRGLLSGLAATFATTAFSTSRRAQETRMNRFGLHGKLIAHPGQRDALAQILLQAAKLVSPLPGCEIYFVSKDETDTNAIYVTEVWTTEAAHKASLQMPEVRALIEKGRPMVASFGESTRLVPIGGHGLRG
jgi:quinol monooxygenase YgiN